MARVARSLDFKSTSDFPRAAAGRTPFHQTADTISILRPSRTSSSPIHQTLPSNKLACVVISGGSAANNLVGALQGSESTTFVLPISDDGGSSSEILRVFGGPSVGDIRSRLIRLIPDAPLGSPLAAIRALLEYRLSDSLTSTQVRAEWHCIVEGRHKLWKVSV